MPLSFRHVLSLAGLALASGFFACREPTQITLNVTTDALCPQANLTAPRIVDTTFATGKVLDPQNFTAATLTAQCETGDPNVVGTLVLLPSGSDDLTVEVLVVAGVELAGPAAEIDPLRLSSEGCQELIRAGGVGAIQGKPCILVRRRLGFVEHTKLELPIDLDTRCIGKKCGEDESCFKGNCVSIDIDCNANGCVEPETCAEKCDEYCASGNSTCADNTCQCLPCDDTTCAAACGLKQKIGECEDDDCLCKESCDQAACTAECLGECAGATCGCSSCDDALCEAGGPTCSCNGSSGGCVCLGACEDVGCAQQECGALGFVGACGELMGQEACICACDDTQCDADCQFGGSCQANGLCGCNPECVDAECGGQCSIAWKKDQCVGSGCACVCDTTLCAESCQGVPGSTGSHCTMPGDPAGVCDCEVNNPTGGGGAGGDGGNGATTTSTGGFGGGGNGGGGGCMCPATCMFPSTCDVAAGCICECDPGNCSNACFPNAGVCNSGNCMCQSTSSSSSGSGGGVGPIGGAGFGLCMSGATYPMPGCSTGMCTAMCTGLDCSTGTCIGPNTCECN